jgi:hypothetical protein
VIETYLSLSVSVIVRLKEGYASGLLFDPEDVAAMFSKLHGVTTQNTTICIGVLPHIVSSLYKSGRVGSLFLQDNDNINLQDPYRVQEI